MSTLPMDTHTNTNTELPCFTCKGAKKVRIYWVDADLRERSRLVPCRNCNGTGKVVVIRDFKKAAANDN